VIQDLGKHEVSACTARVLMDDVLKEHVSLVVLPLVDGLRDIGGGRFCEGKRGCKCERDGDDAAADEFPFHWFPGFSVRRTRALMLRFSMRLGQVK
jgi:hypothetical protein